MTTLREAAQQALEAMLNFPNDISDEMFESITALKAALAEPVQEPVAWGLFAKVGKDFVLQHPVRFSEDDAKNDRLMYPLDTVIVIRPLYTAPPQRKPLTEEEIEKLLIEHAGMTVAFSEVDLRFARAIERAHGIGGNDE